MMKSNSFLITLCLVGFLASPLKSYSQNHAIKESLSVEAMYLNESTFTIDDKIIKAKLVDCSETGLPVTYLVFELKSELSSNEEVRFDFGVRSSGSIDTRSCLESNTIILKSGDYNKVWECAFDSYYGGVPIVYKESAGDSFFDELIIYE